MEDGRVQPLPYTFDDIVTTLNQVLPYDWTGFLRTRLDSHAAGAPLQGLERSGWRLAYGDKPSEFSRAAEGETRADDFAYSLGMMIEKEGKVDAVLWGSPAFAAGVSPAVQLVAVNGRAYKADRLGEAITANKDGKSPLALLLKDGDLYRTVNVDYRGGLRYPRLERVPATTERLDAGPLAPRSG